MTGVGLSCLLLPCSERKPSPVLLIPHHPEGEISWNKVRMVYKNSTGRLFDLLLSLLEDNSQRGNLSSLTNVPIE